MQRVLWKRAHCILTLLQSRSDSNYVPAFLSCPGNPHDYFFWPVSCEQKCHVSPAGVYKLARHSQDASSAMVTEEASFSSLTCSAYISEWVTLLVPDKQNKKVEKKLWNGFNFSKTKSILTNKNTMSNYSKRKACTITSLPMKVKTPRHTDN